MESIPDKPGHRPGMTDHDWLALGLCLAFAGGATLLHHHLAPIAEKAREWHEHIIQGTGPYPDQYRVLTVWLYNNTGRSVFAAALFHAMQNVSWQLFPNRGSHYDPRFTGPVLACAAVAVAILWGPRTLTRSRLVNPVTTSRIRRLGCA